MSGEAIVEELQSGGAFSNGEIRDAGLDARVNYLSEKLSELQLKLETALARIAHLEGDLIELRDKQSAAGSAGAPRPAQRGPAAEQPVLGAGATSSTIQDVLRKVYSGDAEGAQKLLLSLSKDEMARNTSVVALVAATLCIQRGDMNAGLTALQRARQFTDDPRLLRVIDLVEGQLGLQPS
ncbi:hypothetical protein IT575_00120 [bacterium]|nr:hypothetical protein [bacterium]